jgi:hypothetical protein
LCLFACFFAALCRADDLEYARNASFGKLPPTFELNAGQEDPRVRYLSRRHGATLLLTSSGAVLRDSAVELSFQGARPNPLVEGLEPVETRSNYYLGNDPSRWKTGIPHYARVRYRDVWPGVDVVFYAHGQELEYDFVIQPGASLSQVRMKVSGAGSLRLDPDGGLLAETEGSVLRQRRPLFYQEHDGVRREVQGRYVLRGAREFGFEAPRYDRRRTLWVDPVLTYSTYAGGAGDDYALSVAADALGSAYFTGVTSSVNLPTTPGAAQPAYGGCTSCGSQSGDIFVAKLNATGTTAVYLTYFGGSSNDRGIAIAVDLSGNAYVTGFTSSANFPTSPGAYRLPSPATNDAILVKLGGTGALVYSTTLGPYSAGNAIAVDGLNRAVVGGSTSSSGFPTTPGAFQTAFGGYNDGFIFYMNAAGNAPVYSSFLGAAASDSITGLALDSLGQVTVTGTFIGSGSASPFPTTTGAFQTVLNPSSVYYTHSFVSRVNAAGSALVYSTLVAGTSYDTAYAVAVDGLGNAYITGSTASSDFPVTPGAFQTAFSTGFVLKLNPTGTALVYSTFFGVNTYYYSSCGSPLGRNCDAGAAIAVDSAGNAFVAGSTFQTAFPTTPGALQTSLVGGYDAFLLRLDPAGNVVGYSTLWGGPGSDVAEDLALDANGNVYIAGWAAAGFPTAPAVYRNAFSGGTVDAMAIKLNAAAANCPAPAISPAVASFSSSSGAGAFAVNGSSACTFIATPNATWLSVMAPAYFSGSAIVNYSVGLNNSTSYRTGLIMVGGQAFSVVQAAACVASISPTSAQFSASGGLSSVTVLLPSNCTWLPAASAGWITIGTITSGCCSGSGGYGPGSFNFSVAPNTGALARFATIYVAGLEFTVSQAAQLPQPRSVFRDTSSGIQMTTFGQTALSNAGGVFGSSPSMATRSNGEVFTVARDNSNAVWVNVFTPATQLWTGWQYGGGITQGVPAIAVTSSGTAWVAARDSFNSYWLRSYASGPGWGAWTALAGIFSTDPAIAACADGSVYVIGKDNSNSLWSGRYIPGVGFQNWQPGGGIFQGKPSATCGSDNAVYVAARDNFNSNWVARVTGNTWTGTFYGAGVSGADPKIAALAGVLAVVIRDPGGVVWRAGFNEGPGNGWQGWTQVGGVLQDSDPAALNGELFLAGRTSSNDLWWWRQTGNQWTWLGGGVATGGLASGPR